MIENSLQAKRMAIVYAITGLLVFLVLVILGLTMRLNQAAMINLPPDFFYAMMTLHGLGMVGVLYVGAYVGVWYLVAQHAKPSLGLFKFNYVLTLIGVVGLIAATLIGKFGPGWYVLYPLPFIAAWPHWAIGTAVISLMLLGVSWLLGQLDILRAVSSRYGFGNALGWDYLFGNGPKEERPAMMVIVMVAMLAGALTTVVGAAMLMLYLAQWLNSALQFDALMMKNMVFLFGHTLVNITLYFGIAAVYEMLPHFSGRAWKMNKIVALAWNLAFFLVLLAYFHHLYFDFGQPTWVQYLGQIASYLSAVPATVVTVFGVFMQVYRADIKWSFVPLAFILGVMGWIIGGLAAVVDSTIRFNLVLHNSMWVPGHFHTYFLLGVVLMFLGVVYFLMGPKEDKLAKFGLWAIVLGGYGFVAMFFWAGVNAVPRRLSNYATMPIESVAQIGITSAHLSVGFILLIAVGALAYYWSVFKGVKAAWAS